MKAILALEDFPQISHIRNPHHLENIQQEIDNYNHQDDPELQERIYRIILITVGCILRTEERTHQQAQSWHSFAEHTVQSDNDPD